jgi:hypothetical protein
MVMLRERHSGLRMALKKEREKTKKKNGGKKNRFDTREGRDKSERWQATVLFRQGWCRLLPQLCR